MVHVYFQPNVKIDMAMAQITAIANSATRAMPPGIFPPTILKYDASSVPILQLGLESKTLSEQEIYDLAQNFIRTPLATVQGAAVPGPYGGKQRQVVVDLDPNALYAKQLSAIDVSNAFNLQNLILPAGTIKVGDTRVSGAHEQQSRDPQRPEQSADQDGERRHGLLERRRHGARRILGADQHRADQRNARRAADHPAQRPGFHARHRQQGEGGAAQN